MQHRVFARMHPGKQPCTRVADIADTVYVDQHMIKAKRRDRSSQASDNHAAPRFISIGR